MNDSAHVLQRGIVKCVGFEQDLECATTAAMRQSRAAHVEELQLAHRRLRDRLFSERHRLHRCAVRKPAQHPLHHLRQLAGADAPGELDQDGVVEWINRRPAPLRIVPRQLSQR